MRQPSPEEPPDDGRESEDDTAPGTVFVACVLLWLQGVLGAALFLYAVVTLIGIWIVVGGDRYMLEGLGGLAVMTFSVVALLVAVTALAVTIPSCILAARIPSRRDSVRAGALTLEAIVGVSILAVAVLLAASFGSPAFGVLAVVIGVLPWIVFGLLMSASARAYFRV